MLGAIKVVALYDQGKCDEAIKAFDEAIKLNPQDPIARYAKGLVLQELGHSVEADAAFAKAKELGYQG
jgi:Flp pilus assembly protein TadD